MPDSDRMDRVSHRLRTHTMGDGRKLIIHSLGLQDFVAVREEALARFKRERIKTWTANADLIPEEMRAAEVLSAFRRAEELSFEDLPAKQVQVPRMRKGKIVRDADGAPVTDVRDSEYATWWMAETIEGMMFAAWLSLRKDESQKDFTLDDVDAMFGDALGDLDDVANTVGELSEPRVLRDQEPEGNHQAPAEDRRGRKRRRRTGRS